MTTSIEITGLRDHPFLTEILVSPSGDIYDKQTKEKLRYNYKFHKARQCMIPTVKVGGVKWNLETLVTDTFLTSPSQQNKGKAYYVRNKHNLYFKDGDFLNLSVDNLEWRPCITSSDLMTADTVYSTNQKRYRLYMNKEYQEKERNRRRSAYIPYKQRPPIDKNKSNEEVQKRLASYLYQSQYYIRNKHKRKAEELELPELNPLAAEEVEWLDTHYSSFLPPTPPPQDAHADFLV